MNMARLQKHYREKVAPELMAKFGFKSVMQVPRLTKITLNMGVSEAVADKKVMDNAVADLTKIAGQKPVVTKSKKAIAGFKIREGQAIGCMVTLRGVQMFEFLDRFVTVALPRVRDFRGISGFAFRGSFCSARRATARSLSVLFALFAMPLSSACFFAYLATNLSRLSSRSIKAILAKGHLSS